MGARRQEVLVAPPLLETAVELGGGFATLLVVGGVELQEVSRLFTGLSLSPRSFTWYRYGRP